MHFSEMGSTGFTRLSAQRGSWHKKVKSPYSIKTEIFTVLHALIPQKIHIRRISRI
jgi:hypothetical protein